MATPQATTQGSIDARIAAARQAGLPDTEIFKAIADSSKFGIGYRKARASGLSDTQIAQDLGLNITVRAPFVAPDINGETKQRLRQAAKDEGKTSLLQSGLLGFSDLGAGVLQGVHYVGDKVQKVANDKLGTKFDTNEYQKFTQQRNETSDWHDMRRQENGQGFDWGRLAGQMIATAPAPVAKLPQGAKLASLVGAKFLGKNAATGAAIAGASFANDANQRAGNLFGGAVGGAAGAAIGKKVGDVAAGITKRARVAQTTLSDIDAKLGQMLQEKGMSFGDLTAETQNNLRTQAAKLIKAGKDLDADATARQALLSNMGIQPTRAQVTRNPKVWQQERELAKIQGAGDPLRDKYVQNNAQILQHFDDLSSGTGGNAPDQYGAMKSAADAASNKIAQNKKAVADLYTAARNAPGNDVPLNGAGFANDAITVLEQNYAAHALPPDLHKLIKDIADAPNGAFTLGKAEEAIKVLNAAYKNSLNNGQATEASHAIGLVRQALNGRRDEALQGLSSQGNDAASLYQMARQAHKANTELIDSMPFLEDVKNGVEPDKLFTKHVLNGNVSELDKTMQFLQSNDPQAAANIRQQVVEHIMGKAVNNNGQPSPAAMQRVLKQIGDRKLGAVFSPEEVSRLKNIGAAMQYLMAEPAHSNVNHSNTASAAFNFLMQYVNKPGIRIALSPIKDLGDSIAVKKTMQPSIAGDTIPRTAGEQNIVDQLTRVGLLSGANLPKQ